jgi:hypothetical protein
VAQADTGSHEENAINKIAKALNKNVEKSSLFAFALTSKAEP